MAPTTPPPKNIPLVQDTVPVPRFTSQSSYRSGDLAEGRLAVVKDLKRYRKVPYHRLVCSAFGPSPDVSHVRQNLISCGALRVLSDECTPRWSSFSTPPSRSSVTESVAFGPLATIISTIFNEISDCRFECVANPSVQPLSERGNTSRPDAFIKRKYSDFEKTHWFDIAIPFEFKGCNTAGTRQDNEWKMIWSLHNIMREDPLRRFTLGITVEDTDMRIWYLSRALLTVSEPINFVTAIDDVISLFYSIGSKTEVELGWDPTVERITVENETQYKFEIGNQIFTTTRPLATFGADVTVGRGTRVYEARDEQGHTVAIKDSWRDEDREPEGKILEMIFHDIGAKLGEEKRRAAERYIVRVRNYEDVHIFGEIDKTLHPGEDGNWVDIDDRPILSTRRHLSSIGHIPSCGRSQLEVTQRAPPLSDNVNVPRRVHARTVFSDVGDSLMNVTDLVSSFTCLSDSREALYYLHKAGWVHRDFSPANVLWVPEGDTSVGKLTDFEFAKKVDSSTSHNVRTGTMHFMAVEVSSQTYQFAPDDTNVSSTPPFRMNLLHDLESQWWTAMWTLFYYTDKGSPTEVPDQQHQRYEQAFPPEFNAVGRLNFFMLRNVLLPAYATLSGAYHDRCKSIVEHARALHNFYRRAEKSYPEVLIEDGLLEEAHEKTSKCYSTILEELKEPKASFSLQPLHSLRGKNLKRLSENLDDLPVLSMKKKRSRGG